jgi:hypothetical protein
MKTNKLMLKSIIAIILLLLMVLVLTCCAFDKDAAELSILETEFEYYEETNITLVKCDISVSNKTLYDINSFDLVVKVYSKGECIDSKSRHYDYRAEHDDTEYGSISFTVDGHADYAALATWTPNYEPFWKSIFNIGFFESFDLM